MLYYLLFIGLGFLPSFIWLLFYLQKDRRPEPNKMVLLVFVLGMLITLPAAGIEMVFHKGLQLSGLSFQLSTILYFFIAVAVTEEVFKYLVVRFSALKTQEFDEPIDAMIYMIIAGLGFAAVENILNLSTIETPLLMDQVKQIGFNFLGRSIGATFLHTLTSANIGFFMALSFFRTRYRKLLLLTGILSSSILHGIFNIGITIEGSYKIVIIGAVLLSLFLLVLTQFNEIKKLLTVCRVRLKK